MVKIMEAYSESMPQWLHDALDNRHMNGNNYNNVAKRFDLVNAEFHEEPVPTSNRDKRLKDPNKVNFFLFDDEGTKMKIDYVRDRNGYTKNYNDRQTIIDNLAICAGGEWLHNYDLKSHGFGTWQDVVDHTIHYAWIDFKSSFDSVNSKRVSRAEARKGALALEREMNSWCGNRDKSGYIVDPDKYKKLLANTKLDKYIADFETISNIIEEVKGYISDAIMDIRIDDNTDEYDARFKANKIARTDIKFPRFGSDTYKHNNRYYNDAGAMSDLKDLLRIAGELNGVIKNVRAGRNAADASYKLDEIKGYVAKAEALRDDIKRELGVGQLWSK